MRIAGYPQLEHRNGGYCFGRGGKGDGGVGSGKIKNKNKNDSKSLQIKQNKKKFCNLAEKNHTNKLL